MVARQGLKAEPALVPPRGMEPFLRFTRLPARAVAPVRGVLDGDEGFRLRVGEATDETQLGKASWLFVHRPPGWEDELAGLVRQAERDAGSAAEGKVESELRRQVSTLEEGGQRLSRELGQMAAELAEAKDALSRERRARHGAETDAGRARRQAVALSAEVDELRRQRSALEETVEDLRVPSADVPAAPGAAAPPDEPRRPAVDAVVLAGLLDEAARAAANMAGVLARARQCLEPALEPESPVDGDGRPGPRDAQYRITRVPRPAPPGILDDSIEAAEDLMRAAGAWILVDGYNVTKSARPDLGLAEQRRWLTDAVAGLAARTGARFELVFDGAGARASAPADRGRRQGVQVRFTAGGTEADDALLGLVEHLPVGNPVAVVSDDRRVREGVRHRGANMVGAMQFLAVMGRRCR
ncbi:MAG TPA: NYN domain-containing protein [Acidimicrobiales bacterium]|jgi:predicted RNA-binding protein with PIN domain|nr:NYN domain-containing protein [Acidimicrobiales bacterium]